MELRNLLNDPTGEASPISPIHRTARSESEANFPMADAKQPPQQQQQQPANIANQKFNYTTSIPGDFSNGNRSKPTSPGSNSQPVAPILPTTAPISPSSGTGSPALLPFGQNQQFKNNFGVHMESTQPPLQEWRNPNMNGPVPPKSFDYTQVSAAYKQLKMGGDKSTTNGSTLTEDLRKELRSAQPLQGVTAALRTVERYRNGQIKNEIPIKDASALVNDYPETPFLVTSEVYETPFNSWPNIWKPEIIEKTYAEIYIRDQKNSKDIKRRISEFRYHTENIQATLEDEIWFAKDIPIMHTLSCMNSKKNKNCMGCSNFWKCVQTIHEEIRPWGNSDLLHYEPGHSETILGHVAMHGSFSPAQREMLACDAAYSLLYSDDPAGVSIWGFVSPAELSKLTEEDSLGIQFHDHKTFVDPTFLEKKVKVLYGIQRCGQTVLIPSGWVHWSVKCGRGLSFSASWNFLRLKHIADSRFNVEFNRSVAIYKPVNIASLVISAAYQKLDEFDTVESAEEKRNICEFLFKILPIVKCLVLEELLGEPIALSGLVVLSYEMIIEKFRRRSKLPTSVGNELYQIRNHAPAAMENDAADDDEDIQYSCYHCKYILFNSRRSCAQCKGYDLCEPCYATYGKTHQHKMKKFRRIAIPNLIELVDSIAVIVSEQDELMEVPLPKERNERVERPPIRERNPTAALVERELERELELAPASSRESPKDRDKDYKDKEYKEPTRERRKRREREASPPLVPGATPTKREESSGLDNYDSEVIDCICGNNKDLGFMISCEKCLAWLHGKCVGISKRNEPEEYYCPRCVKKSIALNSAAKLAPKSLSPERKLKEYKLA